MDTPEDWSVLTPDQAAHMARLQAERPDWTMLRLTKLFSDEGQDEGTHVYPLIHPYIAGMQFVLKRLQPPARVLDIGSPLAQTVALTAIGVEVTVVDIRPYPDPSALGVEWVTANAAALPFDGSTWNIVTSFWALAHVGDGRYGDDLRSDGDLQMLREIHRVLRPDGICYLGIGPVDATPGALFNLHRVYSWPWLERELDTIGFEITERVETPVANEMYLDGAWGGKPNMAGPLARRSGFYGIATLRKR